MNLKEAYSILELPTTASPDEAKKRYRDLTKKFHPDINKEPGAEDKFKKINEAYQVVSSGKSTDREEPDWDPSTQPFNMANPFGAQSRFHQTGHIDLHTTLSFKDSILGVIKELKYNRKVKCGECNGNGKSPVNNGCDVCGGKGKVTGRQGNMVFISTCHKCYGKMPTKSCTPCNSSGLLDTETSINVTVPAGVQNNNILRIASMGNYVTSMGFMDQYTDARLHVHVDNSPGLRLEGMDVVTNIEISLLDALRGCTKTVSTILGDQRIDIKAESKNKDEVIIPKLGVNNVGNQRVILDVKYPEEITKLINFLSIE